MSKVNDNQIASQRPSCAVCEAKLDLMQKEVDRVNRIAMQWKARAADMARERDSWEREWKMFTNAWLRELGGKVFQKTHLIDALVLTTRSMVDERAKFKQELEALRAIELEKWKLTAGAPIELHAAASPRPTPSEEPTKGGELSRGIAEPQPLATVADPAGVSEKAVWTRKPGVRDDVLKMAEEPVYFKANIAEVQL